jgi:hypothetical protein
MAKLSLLAGSTSKLLDLFVLDSSSTVGAGLTGLVFNTASLTAYYYREGAASATAITLATMTLGTWATGGFIVVDGTNMPGCYQLGLPNAALAAGAKSVLVMLRGATNMAPVLLEIELTACDNQDGVRLGLTALPNAAAEAAGGLYTRGSGAGQLSQSANGELGVATLAKTLTTYTGDTPQTGDSYARIGANGVSLSALPDLAGVTTLLSRLTAGRATGLDNLDAAVSSRSTYSGGAVASVTAGVTVTTNTDKTGYALSNAGADAVRTRQMTEGYAADGVAPTLEQAVFAIMQGVLEFGIVSTTLTVRKLDKATAAQTFTLNSATSPTSRTRAS